MRSTGVLVTWRLGYPSTLLHCTVMYCIVLYCIVLYCIVFCRIVMYSIFLYCIVLYCIVLYCNVLYCIVLYCTVLYCTVWKAIEKASMHDPKILACRTRNHCFNVFSVRFLYAFDEKAYNSCIFAMLVECTLWKSLNCIWLMHFWLGNPWKPLEKTTRNHWFYGILCIWISF